MSLHPATSPLHLPLALLLLASMGCSKAAAPAGDLREQTLRQHVVEMCKSIPHERGDGCAKEVEARFPRCSGPYLAQQTGSEAFAKCLGFVVPQDEPAPAALGQCDGPAIAATFSVELAQAQAWAGSAARTVDGQSLYVAGVPFVRTSDLRALRLEERNGDRLVTVELSPEAAQRLATTTRDNLDAFLVVTLNHTVSAPKIAAAITGPKLVISAPDARIDELCCVPVDGASDRLIST